MNTPTLPRSAADFRSGVSAAGVLNAGGSIFTHMTGSSEKAAGAFGNGNVGGNMGGNGGNGEHPGFGFGRQGEKQAGLKGFLISRPVESLPRYVPKPGTGNPNNGAGAGPSRSSSRASSRDSRDSRDSVDDLGHAAAAPRPNRI